MIILHKGNKLDISTHKVSFFRRGIGLMFRTSKTKNLLFNFEKDVNASFTSLFVFFPFIIVWLDKENRVLETRTVYPFTVAVKPEIKFRKVIELPFNDGNREIISFLVGKRKV